MPAVMPSPGETIRQDAVMMIEPVIGPTSGMSEDRNATNANSAGSGAPMMVRKIA